MSEKIKSPEHSADGWLSKRRMNAFFNLATRIGLSAAVVGAGLMATGALFCAALPWKIGALALKYGLPTGFIGLGGEILTSEKPKK